MTNLDSILKSKGIILLTKVHIVKAMDFLVVMWKLDHKEGWALNSWSFWMRCWRRLLRVPWTARRSNQSILKEIQSWIFFGRTDAEAEVPTLWPPDAKNWLFGKDPDARKDWRQEEKGMTEGEMVAWHHWLDGHELEQAPRVGDGQESLAFCSPWKSQTSLSDWT